MKPILYSIACLLFMWSCAPESNETMTQEGSAPIAKKIDSVLNQHGDARVDPYFWMRLTDEQKLAEQPDAQTQDVLDYLNKENDYTKVKLKDTEELQEKLYQEMVGRIKQTDESVPYFSNEYWYYTRYQEGNEYPIHCRKKGSLDGPEEVILDVNKLAEGYEYYSARGLKISQDNKLLAFAEDTLSRRVYTIRFLNLETGEYLKDEIKNAEPGGAWANDNQTFFYTSKNNVTLLSEKIWRHQLDNDQSADKLMYHEQDESYYIGVYKSKSDQYIIIYNSSTLVSDYHILDANDPTGEFKQFTPRGANHEYSIDHFEDKFYIVTNLDAMNFRLMETNVNATSIENWKEVIPHRKEVLLSDIEVFKNHLVITERSNALTQLRIIDQNSKEEHYLDFGEPAYVVYSANNPEFETDLLRYGYSSLTTPNSTYDYNMNTREKELKKQTEVVGGHEPTDYITERVFAEARDGIKVPVSLVYKKGLVKDGSAPMVLYAYGSYGSSSDPWFNSSRLSLLDRGFIWAIAHIRGGQEMGRQWYEDGKMFKKKNTFNDFVDCAQFLQNEGYTSAAHQYAYGGSAGGLLMGAVVNQAPEKFNGVIAAVPFVDVISTMLDESIPLTTGEFDEWGNPKNLESYEYMLSYSPYDQVKAQDYPNMLVTTGYFDSQVQYWEPAKWVAKLRDKKTDDNLLLMDTNMDAGHGGASGRFKRYRETALKYAFFLKLENITE
ncbi:MAG: S9 family peptidase [Cyclobacteriaceae bacterium]